VEETTRSSEKAMAVRKLPKGIIFQLAAVAMDLFPLLPKPGDKELRFSPNHLQTLLRRVNSTLTPPQVKSIYEVLGGNEIQDGGLSSTVLSLAVSQAQLLDFHEESGSEVVPDEEERLVSEDRNTDSMPEGCYKMLKHIKERQYRNKDPLIEKDQSEEENPDYYGQASCSLPDRP